MVSHAGKRAADRASRQGHVRIGLSGWSYAGWRGVFYPANLPPRDELRYAARNFSSLEVNRSFYSLLSPSIYSTWYEQTPAGYVLSLKGGQFITHSKKLRDVQKPLANFFASGPLALEEKLGPIVWQLPRNLTFDPARLEAFLKLLPKTTGEAAQLAQEHDERLRHGAHCSVHVSRPLRHAIEPRHATFATPAFATLMRRFGVAIAVSESPDWPCFEEVTARFVYVRLHGSQRTYASRYTDDELARWAERIRRWRAGSQPEDARRISALALPRSKTRDVYVYFDNDAEVHAPFDALRLMARFGAVSAASPARAAHALHP